jgi:glycosyltransferase involved in cell wall biosynthesis
MLISIVTVVYNCEETLEKTIQSVINQTYENIEYIIIDGGSTDSTLDIIKKYEENISYWISEKDGGIYDAMNKGASVANGDFVIFMNAGDNFYSINILEKILQKIKDKSKVYFARAKLNKKELTWLYPSQKITSDRIDNWLKKALPNHQAMLFPKHFYKNVSYNTKYKIGSDSDYKFEAKKKCGFIFIDEVVCEFELDGVSSTFDTYKNTKKIMKDSWEISMKHEGFLYAIERQVRIFSKYLISKIVGNSNFSNFHYKIKS